MESGFVLTVMSDSGGWWWLVQRNGYAFAQGVERSLTAAKVVAEDAARGLAGNPWRV